MINAERMGSDHRAWKSEQDAWLEALELWLGEYHVLRRELASLTRVVDAHLLEMRAHYEELIESQRGLAEHDRLIERAKREGAPGSRSIEEHEREARDQAARAGRQSVLEHRHDLLRNRLLRLVTALDDGVQYDRH